MTLDVHTLFLVTIYVEGILGLLLLFRLGAEHGASCRVLVGLCPCDPACLDRAVRTSKPPRSPYRSTAAQAARVIAPAGEEVIDGIGVGESLVARMESAPGGFEENYGLMFEALIDAGDACADPKAVVAAWDESPPTLQTKIASDFWRYPVSDIEARHRRVKAKCTLEEAAALERLRRAAR